MELRDHFDFVLVRSLISLVGWNHNYSELCSEDVQSRNVNTGTMDDKFCTTCLCVLTLTR